MKRWFLLVCLMGCFGSGLQALRTYTVADSLRVMELLGKGKALSQDACLPLYFAECLKGLPYVASTLEVNSTEQLVVNLRELDCTTLVENVVALVLAVQTPHPTFDTFCRYLEQIRYRDGRIDGYASRNHYFSEWIDSNEKQGLVREVKGSPADGYYPFTALQRLKLNYMSLHPGKYLMLKGRPQLIRKIRENEKAYDGKSVRYVPVSLLNGGTEALSAIHDGDILAIVTRKEGLDTSHLGLAVWVKNKLHLWHASSIHKKVVLEPVSLWQYMKKHPSQLGVRVIRICR